MKKYIIILTLAFLSLSFFSCHSSKQATDNNNTSNKNSYYGEKFTPKNVISYDELYTMMQSKDSLSVIVRGNISAVCQVKGCWVHLVGDNHVGQDKMVVKFKDYGFFMPFDSDGQEVVLRGVAFREVTSVDELKHYAEDEGLSQEEIDKITEPIKELKFIADGVILKPAVIQ